jgi:biofilm PGA synthesis N-glycosyltransferase PgaC
MLADWSWLLSPFLVIPASLVSVHLLVPYLYYRYMSKAAKRPWNIIVDSKYEPKVTIIIPTYNESSVIAEKLQNLKGLLYPREKLEVLLVDSCSTDETVNIAKKYLQDNEFPFEIKILEEKERSGKAKALNFALKHASGQIVATSDADSYWEPSALQKATSYLADPQVGALTGKEKFLNLNQNVMTVAEGMYRDIYNNLRIGESKIHSTQFFQGELSLYKREAFQKFNDEKGSDDSGTVKNIISRGFRTIFIPEAVFSDRAPYTWKGRLDLKERRALHVVHALVGAAKLKRKKRFPQPAGILYANCFIHLINPFLIFAFPVGIICLAYMFPYMFLLLLLLSLPVFLAKKARILLISYLTSNLALVRANLKYMRGEEQVVWKKIDEMRQDQN